MVDGGTRDASDPEALPSRCFEGTAAPCRCDDGSAGFRYCVSRDVWGGSCECPLPGFDAGVPDAAVFCTGEPETCDGLDNDCDGVVDDGEPCLDPTVGNTLPYDGGVWLAGTSASSCDVLLRRVWPMVGTDTIEQACEQEAFQFDETGSTLYFFALGEGISRVVDGSATWIPTPPCFRNVQREFAVDPTGQLHYRCADALYRGDGELIVEDASLEIATVLSSGRVVAYDTGFDNYVLIDTDGTVLSHSPIDEWISLRWDGHGLVSRSGDSAFVILNRYYRRDPGFYNEHVVLRVDGATNSWHKVRRVPVDGPRTALALPNGHVIQLWGAAREDWALNVFPPDGPPRVLFDSRDPEAPFDVGRTLVPGPVAIP